MSSYAPIFRDIVNSSLWEEPLNVRVLFVTMLALKEADNVVRVEPHHLPRMAMMSAKEVSQGLKVLENPDKRVAEIEGWNQEYEGRRIERVEGGWLILNGQKYQDKMQEIHQRARWAKAQAAKRQREKESKLKRARRASSVPDGGEK